MSWQAYVDQSLVGTGNVDKAAIFSVKGDSVWAASPGFQIDPKKEMPIIVDAFSDSGRGKVQAEGFHVAGQKFVVLKADDRSLYGKQGKEGICIVKTTQAILVAHYPEGVQPGSAANTVEQLADYLIGVGY